MSFGAGAVLPVPHWVAPAAAHHPPYFEEHDR
jgi:hypothetical protein